MRATTFGLDNALGRGFFESNYQRALVVALQHRGLRTRTEVPIELQYLGVNVGEFRLDLVVNVSIVVECKCAEKLAPPHRAQVISYLHATNYPLGLLFNFGPKPKFERFIHTRSNKPPNGAHQEKPAPGFDDRTELTRVIRSFRKFPRSSSCPCPQLSTAATKRI